ncbi:MAG: signal peptide peptidase SppA [Candidatus Undinarchaeales archaeon]
MAKKTLLVLLAAVIIFVVAVAVMSTSYPKQLSGEKIAVIRIQGTISSQEAFVPTSQAKPKTIIGLLEKAEEDPSVKAVVIEINSPGGSAVASDEIASKVKEMNKTTVAWIGDLGASGAYWVASSSDAVVAHPLSLTCSVGAYTLVSDWSGLFEEYGINYTIVKSGELKDIGSMYREMTPEEERIFQDMVDTVFEEFISEVKENRELTDAQTQIISDGRPCLGKDAVSYGLADYTGSEEDAIALAQQMADLKKKKVVIIEEEKGGLSELFGDTFSEAFYSLGVGLGEGLKSSSEPALNV